MTVGIILFQKYSEKLSYVAKVIVVYFDQQMGALDAVPWSK